MRDASKGGKGRDPAHSESVAPVQSGDRNRPLAHGRRAHGTGSPYVDETQRGHAPSFQDDLVDLERRLDSASEQLSLGFEPMATAGSGQVVGHRVRPRPPAQLFASWQELAGAATVLGRSRWLSLVLWRRIAAQVDALPLRDVDLLIPLPAADAADSALRSPYAPLVPMRDRVVYEVSWKEIAAGGGDVWFHLSELRGLGYRLAVSDLTADGAQDPRWSRLPVDIAAVQAPGETWGELVQAMAQLKGVGTRVDPVSWLALGVDRPKLITELIGAGFDLVHGSAVGAPELGCSSPV